MDWLNQFQETKFKLCNALQLAESLFEEHLTGTLSKVLESLNERQFFRYNGLSQLPGIEWPLYSGSCETSSNQGGVGLLPFNIDLLNKQLSLLLHMKSYQLDYRTLLPAWRVIGLYTTFAV
jgi:hypothetical protein